MNQLERQATINRNADKIKGYRKDWNCVKFNAASTDDHELMKAAVCLQACKKGFTFLTEAEFKEGGRADIYLVDVDFVIEILCSETQERFDAKKYPVKKIIPIRVGDEVNL